MHDFLKNNSIEEPTTFLTNSINSTGSFTFDSWEPMPSPHQSAETSPCNSPTYPDSQMNDLIPLQENILVSYAMTQQMHVCHNNTQLYNTAPVMEQQQQMHYYQQGQLDNYQQQEYYQQQQQQLLTVNPDQMSLVPINMDTVLAAQYDSFSSGDSSPSIMSDSEVSSDDSSKSDYESEKEGSEAEQQPELKKGRRVPKKTVPNKESSKSARTNRKSKKVVSANSQNVLVSESCRGEISLQIVRYPRVIIQKGCGRYIFKVSAPFDPKFLKLITVLEEPYLDSFKMESGMSSLKSDGQFIHDPTFSRNLDHSSAKEFHTISHLVDTRTMKTLASARSDVIRFYFKTNDLPSPVIEEISKESTVGGMTKLRARFDRFKRGTSKRCTLFVVDSTTNVIDHVIPQANINSHPEDSDIVLFDLASSYLNSQYRLHAAYTFNPLDVEDDPKTKKGKKKGDAKSASANKKTNNNYKEKNCIRYEGKVTSLIGQQWQPPVEDKETQTLIRWQSLAL